MEYVGSSFTFGRLLTLGDLAPNLWFDVSDPSARIINTGKVQQLDDKSGNSYHLTNVSAGGAAWPLLTTAGQGGRDVATFDGADDMLSRASVGATGLTSVTIIAVMKMLGGSSTHDLPMGIGRTGETGRVRAMYRAASGATLGFAGWTADVISSTQNLDINGGFHVFGAWNTQLAAPDNVRLMRDGTVTTHTTKNDAAVNVNLLATFDGFSIGSLQGTAAASYMTNFQVGEVGVWYRVLSDSDRQKAEGSLAYKWSLTGLPSGHPFKSAPPYV